MDIILLERATTMSGRPPAASCILLLWLLLLPSSRSSVAVPVLTGLEPSHGSAVADTTLTVTGEGFEPGARVSLLGGGPFLAGSFILPEGAHGITVSGTHAYVTFYDHVSKLGGIQTICVK